MGFNIANFRSVIDQKGLLRTNKFKVRILPPPGMRGITNSGEFNNTSRYLEFFCDMASIPGAMIATHDGRRYSYGPNEKRPFSAVFTDIQFSFYSDGEGLVWNYIRRWMNMIYNFDRNTGTIMTQTGEVKTGSLSNGIIKSYEPYELSYREEYVTDISIIVYDQEGNEIKTIILREAFPTALADMPLNWNDNNSLLKIPATFSFIDWYRYVPSSNETTL